MENCLEYFIFVHLYNYYFLTRPIFAGKLAGKGRRDATIAEFKDSFYIIPSIREIKNLSYALQTDLQYVLLSNVHIGNLKALVECVHKAGKKAIVTVELIRGFNLDRNGAQFLKQMFHVDAVILSNSLWVNYLHKLGLYTILRVVLMDSLALENSIRVVSETSCDAVELRPAIYGLQFVDRLRKERPDLEFFLGGFIRSKETVERARRMKFKGITLSDRSLWNLLKTK